MADIYSSVSQWEPLAKKYGSKYNVDPSLILAVISQESNGNPNDVSSAGAMGLMQLMPATASGYGASNAFDPEQNIAAGTKFLAQLIKNAGGNVSVALGHYYGSGSDVLGARDGIPSGTYPNQVLARMNIIKSKIGAVVAGITQALVDLLHKFYSASITQGYGPTDLQLEPSYQGYAHFHQGIDLGINGGTDLPALVGGVISKIVNDCTGKGQSCGNGYGNQIWVKMPSGDQVLYGHLKSVNVQVGQSIGIGQIIGVTNNTGASTGAHLHLAIQDSAGNWQNPSTLLDAIKNSKLSDFSSSGPGGLVGLIGNAAGAVGDAAGSVGDAVGGVVGGVTDGITGLYNVAKEALGILTNALSYITDPNKRPILIFIILGISITLYSLRAMILSTDTGKSINNTITKTAKVAALA